MEIRSCRLLLGVMLDFSELAGGPVCFEVMSSMLMSLGIWWALLAPGIPEPLELLLAVEPPMIFGGISVAGTVPNSLLFL